MFSIIILLIISILLFILFYFLFGLLTSIIVAMLFVIICLYIRSKYGASYLIKGFLEKYYAYRTTGLNHYDSIYAIINSRFSFVSKSGDASRAKEIFESYTLYDESIKKDLLYLYYSLVVVETLGREIYSDQKIWDRIEKEFNRTYNKEIRKYRGIFQ